MKFLLSTSIVILVLISCLACNHEPDSKNTNDALLQRLTKPSKPWERSQAIDEMHRLSVEEQHRLVPALIEKLSAWNRYVRQNAAETLGELDEVAEDAVPFLRKATSDSNRDVAMVAKVTLARLGHDSEETLDMLIGRLGVQSGELEARLNRYNAANAIGFIASGSLHSDVRVAVPALIRALQDPDEMVRERAAWALGSTGPQAEQAVEALKQSAWNDPSRNVRYLASWALRQVGTPGAKEALEGWVLSGREQISPKSTSVR